MNSENQVTNSSRAENNSSDVSKTDEQENINKKIYIYQNLFVSSVISIVNLIKSVSQNNDDKINPDKKQAHEKLRLTCDDILNQYKNTTENIDQVRIIKKVFKVLSANYKLIKEKNNALFSVRTPEGKIMTIIPGLNINLCLDLLDDTQTVTLWDSIETMFVTSVKMVYLMTDKSRHDKNILFKCYWVHVGLGNQL
jgi:galactose-1-phosphate uridylyltransferase